MPVAEAEIITGAFTEYSAMKFAFGLFAAEYIAMIGMSALAATLFLGGYKPVVRIKSDEWSALVKAGR